MSLPPTLNNDVLSRHETRGVFVSPLQMRNIKVRVPYAIRSTNNSNTQSGHNSKCVQSSNDFPPETNSVALRRFQTINTSVRLKRLKCITLKAQMSGFRKLIMKCNPPSLNSESAKRRYRVRCDQLQQPTLNSIGAHRSVFWSERSVSNYRYKIPVYKSK